MYGYIYKTTNLVNNNIYIGKHKADCFLAESYLGSGILLQRAIKLYGKNNFSVELIECCNTNEELNNREVYWISYFRSEGYKMYNIASGGDGGDTISGLSDEAYSEFVKKCSIASSKRNPLSEESRRKMSLSKLGDKNPMRNPEIAKKSGLSHVGLPTWMTGVTRQNSPKFDAIYSKIIETKLQRYGNTFGNYDFKKTEDHKQKISNSLRGKIKTEEHRKHLSESLKGHIPANTGRKAYVSVDTGIKKFYIEGEQPEGFILLIDYIKRYRQSHDE